ncbi:hypothetical protein FNF29_07865 [Cafeteria roenbergensis]|uniref:ubiquitinyl hydrolase 1 n=1 Tax=Cafeteria roenbergensis TaxID=33653 RepID=A0A5A8C1V2_CAFRO|nr:hypothetical protein FNF29_07865 [Cafeteria roenbergensis]|eukprot:KAA0146744.1 hypothetical protein FNF29_07865 [Cafeteria roenbergensis]
MAADIALVGRLVDVRRSDGLMHAAMVLRQHAHGEASVVWLSPSAAGLARSESAKQATEGRDVGTTRRVPLRTMLRRGEAVLLPEQSQDQATEVLLAGAAERPSRTGPAALDWQAENALPSDMSSGDIHAVLPDSLGGPGRQRVGGRVRRRASLVGQWVSVHWVADRRWYSGQVRGYSASMQSHFVAFADGDERWYSLPDMEWAPVNPLEGARAVGHRALIRGPSGLWGLFDVTAFHGPSGRHTVERTGGAQFVPDGAEPAETLGPIGRATRRLHPEHMPQRFLLRLCTVHLLIWALTAAGDLAPATLTLSAEQAVGQAGPVPAEPEDSGAMSVAGSVGPGSDAGSDATSDRGFDPLVDVVLDGGGTATLRLCQVTFVWRSDDVMRTSLGPYYGGDSPSQQAAARPCDGGSDADDERLVAALCPPGVGPLAAGGSATLAGAEPASRDACRATAGAGLVNFGNSCYLNAVLQAIAHMQPIASYLALTPAQAAPGAVGSGSVAAAMSALLGSLSAGLHESVVPAVVKKWLSDRSPQFLGVDQHDAHEALVALLDALHEDLSVPDHRASLLAAKDAGVTDRSTAPPADPPTVASGSSGAADLTALPDGSSTGADAHRSAALRQTTSVVKQAAFLLTEERAACVSCGRGYESAVS